QQQDQLRQLKVSERRKDVEESHKLVFGDPVKPRESLPDKYSTFSQNNQSVKTLNSLSDYVVPVNSSVESRVSILEDKMFRDVILQVNQNSEKANILSQNVNALERAVQMNNEDLKGRINFINTDVQQKIAMIDKNRLEDHQKLNHVVEECQKAKEGINSLNNKNGDFVSKLDKQQKEISAMGQKSNEIGIVLKEHDSSINKISSLVTQQIDLLSKRISFVNSDVVDKLSVESKSRQAIDTKYEQQIKEIKANNVRNSEEVYHRMEILKNSLQELNQRIKTEVETNAVAIQSNIQNLEARSEDLNKFVKDNLVKQLSVIKEEVQNKNHENLKRVDDVYSHVMKTFDGQKLEIQSFLQTKVNQFESFQENTLNSVRLLSEKQRNAEMEMNHKVSYFEQLVRDESNSRQASEHHLQKVVQENRSVLISAIEDVDRKIISIQNEIESKIEISSSKLQLEWENNLQVERQKTDELNNRFISLSSTMKSKNDEFHSKFDNLNSSIDKIDKEICLTKQKNETLAKDLFLKFQELNQTSETKINNVSNEVNNLKIDFKSLLDQKIGNLENVLSNQSDEINKRIKAEDLQKIEESFNERLEETKKAIQNSNAQTREKFSNKFQEQLEENQRRERKLLEEFHNIKDLLMKQEDFNQQSFKQQQSFNSKINSEILQRASKEQIDQISKVFNQKILDLESELKMLKKEIKISKNRNLDDSFIKNNEYVSNVNYDTEKLSRLNGIELDLNEASQIGNNYESPALESHLAVIITDNEVDNNQPKNMTDNNSNKIDNNQPMKLSESIE
ncbi:hypothetical protein ROZALSC1DRAFT_25087, partial [Rozella allomycis CSF55]